MSRFGTYLQCAKISRDFLFVAGEQAKRGDTQKALQSLICGMSSMLTAMNNAASIGFDKKPKAPRRPRKAIAGHVLAAVVLMIFAGAGCKRYDKLVGTDSVDSKKEPQSAFYVLACCQDNDGNNNLSWPAFLPAEHVNKCMAAKRACHDNDCHMTGNEDVYLPTGVDCSPAFSHIGSEYYAGHPGY